MKQKTRLTLLQRILDGLSILICLGTVIYVATQYQGLPQQIPSHYDMAGNVTGYQGKSMLIVLLFMMVFVVTLPIIILAAFLQKYLIRGLSMGAVKG